MSVNAIQAQGTKLYIASGSGSAKNVTGIATGFPTIITSASHGFANGDVVTIAGVTGTDAALLNTTLVVTNKTTNTFAVQVDTTGKTVTAAGTATPVTWTQIKELKAFKPGGATANKIDVTDLDSTAKEYLTGLQDSGTVSIEFNALDSDAGQSALRAAFVGSLSKQYKITYPAGVTPNRTFTASCLKYTTTNDASVDGIAVGSAEFQISGAVTVS